VQVAVALDGAGVNLESRKELLESAEAELRTAVKFDPSSAQAALRLGRVLDLMDEHDAALDLLVQAERGLERAELRYCAALFAGRALEALDRTDDARAAFERAAALYPPAQSPRLALARLAWQSGATSDAGAQVHQLLDTGIQLGSDPWWVYDILIVAEAPAMVVDMRETVARMLRQ
jgi:tetratricopeptide (TPR) repeat protein